MLRSVLIEGFVIGLLASVIGLVLGLGLAKGLNAVFKSLGVDPLHPTCFVFDDGAPNQPLAGFPNNYLVNPAVNRAFDNFWANVEGPGGVGIGDRYAQAWRHVAERFAGQDGILGYDLINEPWPGTGWQQCINTAGCPAFDQGKFADFYRRTDGGCLLIEPR